MLLPNFLLFAEKEISLVAGAVRQGEGGLFVYTCFIDAHPECVYDVLEYILGGFPFGGGDQARCQYMEKCSGILKPSFLVSNALK
jgi:hypothetical protein